MENDDQYTCEERYFADHPDNPGTLTHYLAWLSKQTFPAAIRELRAWDTKFENID